MSRGPRASTTSGPSRGSPRSPGPGNVDLPAFPDPMPVSTSLGSVAYSLSFRNDSTRTDAEADRLGPGCYRTRDEVTLVHPRTHSFGRSPRMAIGPAEAGPRSQLGQRGVGPDLDQQDSDAFRRSEKYSFGTTPKFFQCPGLWDEGRAPRLPGPGEHSPDDAPLSGVPRTAGFAFGSRREEGRCAVEAPGPGSYTPAEGVCGRATTSAPRCVFGSPSQALRSADEPRRQIAPRGSTCGPGRHGVAPGPGRYKVVGNTRTGHSHSPKWSFGGRREFVFGTSWN
mmetsp:Transcript_22019/g.75500  ORF Transcript_22019/g.75500 Transcript_22019/m.75500 type:complete len:282 (-) Transcript_22019:42-887(-)